MREWWTQARWTQVPWTPGSTAARALTVASPSRARSVSAVAAASRPKRRWPGRSRRGSSRERSERAAPALDRLRHLIERATLRAEPVLDAHRRAGIDIAP